MDIVNRLGIAATTLPAMAPDGTPLLLLVAKASFELPASGQLARLADVQMPICEVDQFEGVPGLTPPKQEAETVPYKPRCDVLLTGSAYAQARGGAQGTTVGLQVGALEKIFEVWGERHWQRAASGRGAWSLSEAAAFDRLALSYTRAYGGSDPGPDGTDEPPAWPANPLGIGFNGRHRQLPADPRAAHTQPRGQPPADPWQAQPSLGFGPVGRSWKPRLQWAGTFDDAWRQQRFPVLPADFDTRHWQAAPADQQVDALGPGLPVQLWNLTPDGHRSFELPALQPQVRFIQAGKTRGRPMRADTLLLDPDLGRFSLIWRTHWPLLRSQAPVDRIELHHA